MVQTLSYVSSSEMITRTLFIFGCCLSWGLAFPADDTPALEVIQAKEIHLPQQVVLTRDVVKEPFLPTPTPTEAAPSSEPPHAQAQPLAPLEPSNGEVEQGEDLAPPLDAPQNPGDKTDDLETANTFWGGYGGYGGYGGWGWRRPYYYGGWGRGWGGGYGGWGGYGWGGRSYYRPWGGYGGWRW